MGLGFYWEITLRLPSGFAIINVCMLGFRLGSGIYLRVQVGFDFIRFGLFSLGFGFSGTQLHHYTRSPNVDLDFLENFMF